MEFIAETVMGLLIAAQTGALNAASTVATDLGKDTVGRVVELVKNRFSKEGEGANKAIEHLVEDPTSEQAQRAVKRRLEAFLEEDPAFLGEIEALIGKVSVDKSVKQEIHSGDGSTNIQVAGSHNKVG